MPYRMKIDDLEITGQRIAERYREMFGDYPDFEDVAEIENMASDDIYQAEEDGSISLGLRDAALSVIDF